MQAKIHPQYVLTKVKCISCNTEFETRSTVKEISVEVCSSCHPFYTGKRTLVDSTGRVQRFQNMMAKKKEIKKTDPVEEPAKESPVVQEKTSPKKQS